ncbi:hypothetical protein ACFQ6Q_35640 [Streptomyces sp. NPDC056437]|uniref:hypothetical protein n=1 Tax=Streptomyces sp. NPDC056437 TaxID=3345816 RepID=UPI0036A759AF
MRHAGAMGSAAADNAKGESKQSYITGREEAYSALRTRTSLREGVARCQAGVPIAAASSGDCG